MNDNINLKEPSVLQTIHQDTVASGFDMASSPPTGSLLRSLAASKRQGRFLELGTGTGLSAAWILDGMDDGSTLITVDHDPIVTSIAKKHLGGDPRLTIKTMDGIEFLHAIQDERFDFIFADAWPGKYDRLDLALNLLKVGGLYVIDDMLPQENWPAGHDRNVDDLLSKLGNMEEFVLTKMSWASGLVLMVRVVEYDRGKSLSVTGLPSR